MDVWQINTYSRHTSNRTPQLFTVYGSSAVAPPSTNGNPAGWGAPIAAVDTRTGTPPYTTGTSLDGIAGSSIRDDSGAGLGQYRHLLFVIERPAGTGTFFGEIDILAGSHPVVAMEGRYHGAPDNVGTGAITTNPFSNVPTVSAADYAAPSQGHGVTVSIVSGAKTSGSGDVNRLTDGLWPSSQDAPGEVLFSDGADPFRVMFDLNGRVAVNMINTFSRHTQASNPGNGARTPQVYAVYGVDAEVAPAGTGSLVDNGWILIATVDTRGLAPPNGTSANLPGVAGVSINALSGGALGVYTHLLFDLQRVGTAGTFYAEIDVFGAQVPEPSTFTLAGLGLAGVGLALLRRRRCA